MVVAGLLLAAGAGRRMGLPKGLVRGPDGAAWVARSARVLAEGGCDPVLVVVGARGDEVAALVPPSARVVNAPDWSEGMGASLRAGLRVVGAEAGEDVVAVVVGLVDTPGVTPQVVARLVAAGAAAGGTGLARAGYGGSPGHPVVLGRAHWQAAADWATGDEGARGYLAGRRVELVECGDAGDGRDIDAPGEYGGLVSPQTPRAEVGRRPDPDAAHPALEPEHRHQPRTHDTSRIHPPARRVVLTEITTQVLDVAAHEAAVAGASSGAVVTFSGTVRDHDGGRPVSQIEYVGHPSAAEVLARVVADVTARSDVDAVAVSHRIGDLGIGEAALVVAVASAHRQEAFVAAALMVDEVKHQLPVWKRQVLADGTDEWVSCP